MEFAIRYLESLIDGGVAANLCGINDDVRFTGRRARWSGGHNVKNIIGKRQETTLRIRRLRILVQRASLMFRATAHSLAF